MAIGGAIGGTKQRSGQAAEEAPDLPRVTWYKHGGLIRLYAVHSLMDFLLILVACHCPVFLCYNRIRRIDDVIGSALLFLMVRNSLQSVTFWKDYFGNPEGAPLGLLNAIYAVGSMVAMPVFPVIADRFGRRWGIITSAIIMYSPRTRHGIINFRLIAVALQTASQNLAMFTASRFLIGLGVQVGQGNCLTRFG
jgi:MFS family permease